jgi:membrane protein DedA with SNARE-associated domain
MDALVTFLLRHAELVLFVYVFADQIGVPLPAVPVLLGAGAMAAVGTVNMPLAVALAVAGSLLADLVWYAAGRVHGRKVLGFLCRVSLEPDSCVRRTEDLFLRHGVRSLLVAKFVPGLGTVAPPLAGIVGIGLVRFVAYSAGAGLLWAAAWMGIGYAAGDALERVLVHAEGLGAWLGAVLGLVVVAYVVVKWIQRRRFLHDLRVARIDSDELKAKLDAGVPVTVLDVRSPGDVDSDPHLIPGALVVLPEDLERERLNLPPGREIVVYCS